MLDGLQHVLLRRLLSFSAEEELIQNKVGLLKVEDDVQLTHLRRQRQIRADSRPTKTT